MSYGIAQHVPPFPLFLLIGSWMQRIDQPGFCPIGKTKVGGQRDLSLESTRGQPVFSFVMLAAFPSLEVTKGSRSNSIIFFSLITWNILW